MVVCRLLQVYGEERRAERRQDCFEKKDFEEDFYTNFEEYFEESAVMGKCILYEDLALRTCMPERIEMDWKESTGRAFWGKRMVGRTWVGWKEMVEKDARNLLNIRN